jgi:hypothetical protein
MTLSGGRPVIAVDVDGVLNPHKPGRAAALGYQPHDYDGPGPGGLPVSGTVWLHTDHGRWLRKLAGHADLVWCTNWGQVAADVIAPRLGLPDMPVIDVADFAGVRFGHQGKLGPLYAWTGDRPLAVLDDEFGGKDAHLADERSRTGRPTLHVDVDGTTGLRRAHIDQILTWLATLGDTVPPDDEAQDEGDTCQSEALSVGDPALMKSRRLSEMCSTCIFHPGNNIRLSDGRLRDLVAKARTDESYIVCHSTLPGMAPDDVQPAICRGFADRYSTQALQVIERLFGFIDVDPPEKRATERDRR